VGFVLITKDKWITWRKEVKIISLVGFVSIVYIDMCYHPQILDELFFDRKKCANKSIGLNHQVPCIKTSKKIYLELKASRPRGLVSAIDDNALLP
jgi:hypothetical protein